MSEGPFRDPFTMETTRGNISRELDDFEWHIRTLGILVSTGYSVERFEEVMLEIRDWSHRRLGNSLEDLKKAHERDHLRTDKVIEQFLSGLVRVRMALALGNPAEAREILDRMWERSDGFRSLLKVEEEGLEG